MSDNKVNNIVINDNNDDKKILYVFLGNLSQKMLERFLDRCNHALEHGVSIKDFVEAWNSYATSIYQHVFITDKPSHK